MQEFEEGGYERLTALYQAEPRRLSELVKKELATRTLSIDEFLIALDLPYEQEDWQIQQIHTAVDPRYSECMVIRARGGSKTFDMMIVCLYYAYHGFEVLYWCSQASQMRQPKKYLSFLCGKTFLQYAIPKGALLKEEVVFNNEGSLIIGNLTEDNARSPRADLLYFDEEARADQEAYEASDGETSVSKLAKIIHGSTPVKGSLFDLNRKRLEDLNLPILERKWNEIGFMNKKKILAAKARGPDWYFRQEYECSFEAPQGLVFTNVVLGDPTALLNQQRSDYQRHYQHFGVDWNPAAGHYIVGSRWLDSYEGNVVLSERNMGTSQYAAIHTIFDILLENPKSMCELEDGGTNSGYCDALFATLYDMKKTGRLNPEEYSSLSKRLARRPWDSAGKNKMKSINNLLTATIYTRESREVNDVADWLGKAHWDEDMKEQPKLEKDPDQHALDAYLHSSWIGRYGTNY